MHNTVSVTPSGSAVMAIQEDGSVWFWGDQFEDNYFGGSYAHKTTPVKVMEEGVAVSMDELLQYILLEDGTLWGWGHNQWGDLGDGTFTPKYDPIPIMDDVFMMKANSGNGAALQNDGCLYYWGSRVYGDFRKPRNNVATPEKALEQVTYFTEYGGTLLAVLEDDSLWGWGLNDYSQLGQGHNREIPVMEPQKLKENVRNVWTTGFRTYVLDMDETLWGAGRNPYGEIGIGSIVWEIMEYSPILEDVVDFSTGIFGGFHCGAITADGRLWMWGDNRKGQLGIGDKDIVESNVPVYVMDQVIKFHIDGDISIAIRADNSLWVWGTSHENRIEQDFADPSIPNKVSENVHSVYIGSSTILFLKYDGTLWGWGHNETGQLGDGTFENRSQPVLIMENVRLPEG